MGCSDSEGPGHAPRYLDVSMHMKINNLPTNLACFVCECVFSKSRSPLVLKYDADGDIQLLCGENSHVAPDPKIISLDEVRQFMTGHLGIINEMLPGNFIRVHKDGTVTKAAC